MWLISVELASYRPSGANNFEVTAAFLENFCILGYDLF
jgi:hypothetical protein